MKKISISIFIIFLCLFLNAEESKQDRVVILNFNSINNDKATANAVTENFITSIIDLKVFTVIERTQLKKILNELKLTLNDDFDDNTALEIGKLAKAKIVMLGSVTKLGERITINARGIDVETGTALFAKKVTTSNINELPEAIDELAAMISFEKENTTDPMQHRFTRDEPEEFSAENRFQYVQPIDSIPLRESNEELIAEVFPFTRKKEIRTAAELNEIKKYCKGYSSIQIKGNIYWNFGFRFKKNVSLQQIYEKPGFCHLTFPPSKLPETNLELGFFIECQSDKPGNYSIIIHNEDFEAMKDVFIGNKPETYFIPFRAFRLIRIMNKRLYDQYIPFIMEEKIKSPVMISISKHLETTYTTESVGGRKYDNVLEIKDAGFITHHWPEPAGYFASFDQPFDNIKLAHVSFSNTNPQAMTIDKNFSFQLKNFDASFKDESFSKKHLYFQGQIEKEKDYSNEWILNIPFYVLKDLKGYQEVTFLAKINGIAGFELAFNYSNQFLHKTILIPENKWVRIVFPFQDFKLLEADHNQQVPILTFILSNHVFLEENQNSYFELAIDEIVFIK
ncbi:MAG: CsgG/HfaB family protein [Spirochaetes bacterium]|nr:CsgG/HfaB family protein [Spirochaetota bacterium]